MAGEQRVRSAGAWVVMLAASAVWVWLVSATVTSVLADDPPPQQEPAPAPPRAADTPLGQFFNRLFRGMQRPPAAVEPSPADELPQIDGTPRITPDAIDERAAASRQQQRDLLRVARLVQSGEEAVALPMLQTLLDADEDTLVLTPEGRWQSLHDVAELLLVDSQPSTRQAYVARFAALADEQLEHARQTLQPEDFAVVAKRFRLTPAGQAATRALVALARDSGDDTERLYWTQQIIDEDQPIRLTLPTPDLSPNAMDRVAADWPQPFGGPTHHARFPPTEPVLISRWTAPIAVRRAVTEQIDDLVRDLVDNRQACIPTTMPLAVDGKIISRTLRGVSVFDAENGRLLWESAEGASVERLIQGDDVPRPGGEPTGRGIRPIPAYRGTNADGHPLANLLFRDGLYGLVSSDREQVFVLEDHASLSFRQPGYFWGQRVDDDPFDRDWGTNRLVAYDLDQGTVRWQLGGERLDEPFDLPLAGTLFLGPPVIDRDELFVIGEREGTVFLFVLDRLTGQPLWEQAISEVGAAIEQDLVRRWWPAQPAVGRGVIVCPTTAGWMVAIDRLQHRIRWSYRYLETRQQQVSANRSRVAASGPLNVRWLPAAPVMTARHVVFTPQELPDALYGEQPAIICLDLLTGQRLWREEKDDRLYLGGVVDGRVLLVGTDAVEARDLATGKRLWQTRLTPPEPETSETSSHSTHTEATTPPGSELNPAAPNRLSRTKNPSSHEQSASAAPSGRGIVVGDLFLVPLQSGQVIAVGLSSGTVEQVLSLPPDERPLGNLLMYRGRLISIDPFSIRCFERRETIIAGLASDADADDRFDSLFRGAKLQQMAGDLAAARGTLQGLQSVPSTAAQRVQADALLWSVLLQIVENDLTASDAEFSELVDLARTDARRLTVEQTRAARFLARGDRLAAFQVYWELAQTPQATRVEVGPTSVRLDRWLAGRLRQLVADASPTEMPVLAEKFAEAVNSLAGQDEASLRWWADVLRFDVSGGRLRQRLFERARAENKWTDAEIYLLQLQSESTDTDLREWARDQLLALMLDRDRPQDALECAVRFGLTGETGDNLPQTLADRWPPTSGPQFTQWSPGEWTLARSPATFNRAMFEPELAIAPGLPSMNQLTFRVDPMLDRLRSGTLTGDTLWDTPLRAQSASFFNQTTGLASVGQLLFVVHRGVLQAISLADRELRWHQAFDVPSASAGYLRSPSLDRQQELRDFQTFQWGDGLRQSGSRMGMLAVWRPGYVAYFGRNTITLADPLTGETFWQRQGISPQASVYGTDQLLYVIPPASEEPFALRILDGDPVDLPRLSQQVSSAVDVNEQGLLQVEQHAPFQLFGWGKPVIRWKRVDPLTGSSGWTLDFPITTRFVRLDERSFLAVTPPEGTVQFIDGHRGQQTELGVLGNEVMSGMQRMFAIKEQDRVYLAINQPPKPGSDPRISQSIPLHGTLAAFNPASGLLWKKPIEGQNLMLGALAHLPCLILTSQRTERNDNVAGQQVFVEVRDRETGELLLEDSRYITGGNLREMEVDHARQLIDLKTYNDRLRLQISAE